MANKTDKFDPDAYLASVAPSAVSTFDPDSYLAESEPVPQSLFAQSTADEPWRPFFNSREEYDAALAQQGTTDTESPEAKLGMAGRAAGASAVRLGLPAAAVAAAPFTGGASLAALAGAAGVAGEYIGSKIEGEAATTGQLLSSGIASAVPGAPLVKSGLSGIVREGVKQGIGNVVATTAQTGADQDRLPTMDEAAMSLVGGLVASPASKAVGGAVPRRLSQADANMAKRADVIEAWRKAGGVVDPSLVDKPVFGLTDLAGIEGMNKAASNKNVLVTQRVIRQDLGIPGNGPITVEALDDMRKEAGRSYATVARLSKEASQDLEALKQARFAAREAAENYKNTGNPAGRAEWLKLKDVAQNLEDLVESHAEMAGRSDLVKQLRRDRVLIAKSYDVEAALNPANGQVDPAVLAAAYNGRNMTDGLKLVAEVAGNFPGNMREKSLIGSGASRIGTLFQGQGMAQGTPEGFLAGLYHKAGAPARKLLLSDVIQNWKATNPSNEMAESVKQAMTRLGTLSLARQQAEADQEDSLFMPAPINRDR